MLNNTVSFTSVIQKLVEIYGKNTELWVWVFYWSLGETYCEHTQFGTDDINSVIVWIWLNHFRGGLKWDPLISPFYTFWIQTSNKMSNPKFLEDIEKGKELKKTETVDKSQPVIESN